MTKKEREKIKELEKDTVFDICPTCKEPVTWCKCKINDWVYVDCGIETSRNKCPECGKPTEINPGSYGMQTETEI